MPVEANSVPRLEAGREGGWWLRRWASGRVVAGITSRHVETSLLLRRLQAPPTVEAEQVHGSSVAAIERRTGSLPPVQGCDALVTSVPGLALLIRTADCLPLFFADPSRGVVGLAHVGWRGLAEELPARVLAMCRHVYHSPASELRVVIGPAIRSCCYEVGLEFESRFGRFVQVRGGRRTCDLIGVAMDQLLRCGIRPEHLLDSQRCTACEAQHWFSLRREGQATGRLTALIMVRP